jgi:NADH-quinone oxidoreductase subunit N
MELPTLEAINLIPVLPFVTLVLGTCALVVVDLFIDEGRKYWTGWLAVAVLVVSAALLGVQANSHPADVAFSAFNGMVVVDGFALFLQAVFLLSAFIGILIALNYLPRRGIERGEYYTLLLFTTAGMMIMAMAADLIVVFLAVELLSIPLYILSGFARPDLDSEESAMKYFLLGAFASGFLVYGIAMIYGGTQTTALSGVVDALAGKTTNPILAFVGMGLVLVGLGFKVAAVPFHMWTPDVYQGAPTPVTAFMSVGAKAGGFAALLRVLVAAFPAIAGEWGVLVSVIAGLTMILGNVVAVSQSNIKRMLAYSSIAHAGYILIAVAACQRPDDAPFAVSAAIFYLLSYAVTNLGAFAVVIAVEKDDGSGIEIDDFAGLGRARPGLAVAMTLFMFSLTGVPPSAGLVGKIFVFQSAIRALPGNPLLLAVIIIGAITSVISAFYYLRVVIVMWMREGEGQVTLHFPLRLALVVTAVATFLLGVIPAPIYQMAQAALMLLAG